MNLHRLLLAKVAQALVLIFFVLSASNAVAYMKINYKTDDLRWVDEQLRFDGYTEPADFFWHERISFDISFVVPDFEFSGSENMYVTFDDAVIDVKASHFFDSILITNSRAEIAFFPHEDSLSTEFFLSFDITDATKPENGSAQGGSFSAFTIINEGNPNNINYVGFDYYLDDWIYKRHEIEYELSSSVQFHTDTSWLTIEKVSVPEPFAPALLLTGMALLLLMRARIKPNN